MKINLNLNGEMVEIDANEEEMLSQSLLSLGIRSASRKCVGESSVQNSVVLLNGKPVPSAIIRTVLLDGEKILTLEGFAETSHYQDIINGFRKAEIRPCRHCLASRILCVHELLERNYRPTLEECEEFADTIRCSCTEKNAFIDAVIYATTFRRSREGKRRG